MGAHRDGKAARVTANGIDVLVIGAGTTGLTAALQAHAGGARVRIVDRRSELYRPSRAMMMHPRTLEVLRPLGVTGELLAHGDTSPRAEVHLGSRVVSAGVDQFALRGTAIPAPAVHPPSGYRDRARGSARRARDRGRVRCRALGTGAGGRGCRRPPASRTTARRKCTAGMWRHVMARPAPRAASSAFRGAEAPTTER